MIQKLLCGIASWFEATSPAQRVSRWHILLLVLIVTIGGATRLWELGAVGLHGDEETMAMPAMHIIEHGTPTLPSGMFYARALGQLYLMAASVATFGESEWALRLPSALCGTLLVVLAYFAGRRFLTPAWNLVFTATVAFLPTFIIDAQTARMYVFLVTCVAAMLILIFRWERTGQLAALIGALVVFGIGLHFHSLTIFNAFLFLFPGLLHGDRRKLLHGLIAFGIGVAMFVVIEDWVASQYPPRVSLEDAGVQIGSRARWAVPEAGLPLILAGAAAAAFLGWRVARRIAWRLAACAAGALLGAGIFAQLVFFYHVAFLLLIAGGLIALRHGERTLRPLTIVAAVSAAIGIAHVLSLRSSGVESFRQLFGAMVGQPSVWPMLVVAQYSIAATIAAAAALAVALGLFARRERIPDFMLLFVLGVWVPLLAVGVFQWFVPLRYTEGQVLPLLLAGCAAVQWLFTRASARRTRDGARAVPLQVVAATLAAVAFVNPMAFSRTVGAGYGIHPDHKGAAEFVRSRPLAPEDIVLAEDVLQQTYYLDRVDYWLVAPYVAVQFAQQVDGVLRDIYTAVPVMTSAEELEALIARPDRGAIYVIGSGEQQSDGRRHMRGPEIFSMLQSPRFEVVYQGRDGVTKVWKVARTQPARTQTLEASAVPRIRAAAP